MSSKMAVWLRSETRLKPNTRHDVVASRPVAHDTGLRCDQTIRLNSAKGRRGYPEVLRRISYIDSETDLWLIFLPNQFQLDALTVALIFRAILGRDESGFRLHPR